MEQLGWGRGGPVEKRGGSVTETQSGMCVCVRVCMCVKERECAGCILAWGCLGLLRGSGSWRGGVGCWGHYWIETADL